MNLDLLTLGIEMRNAPPLFFKERLPQYFIHSHCGEGQGLGILGTGEPGISWLAYRQQIPGEAVLRNSLLEVTRGGG